MKKILLAEDDRISRVMLQAVLQKWGYQVESAVNGEDALAKLLHPQGPSVAILDWMMPVLDGLEVCRRIRDTPGIRHIHLILLTSKSKGSDAAAALGVGADDHVSKPYDLIELQARIELGFRRVRWARDCATEYLRPQQISSLMEVNRLAMQSALRGEVALDSASTDQASLGGVWSRVHSAMAGKLTTHREGADVQVGLGHERLEQLLANLYAHWRAAMPQGGEVEVQWRRTPLGFIQIDCRDQGPQFSEAQLLSGALPEMGLGAIYAGMGILFARSLANSVGGGLTWSRPGEGGGLQLELILPAAP